MGKFDKNALPEPLSYFESEGVKLQSRGKWRTAECTFHGGSDSMRINTATGAWVCMAGCGARGGDVLAYHMASHGLDFITAAKALGAWQDDGSPNKPHRPRPLPAIEAIRLLAFESNLTAIAAGNIANGVALTNIDLARVFTAAQRITKIQELFA